MLQRHWLVVSLRMPGISIPTSKLNADSVSVSKIVTLYAWRDEKLAQEHYSCVWGTDGCENIKHLAQGWLSFLYEEHLIEKRVTIDSVALSSQGQEVYISFSKSFLSKKWSIQKKWKTVESLLATIHQAQPSLQNVVFLLRNRLFQDDHLDFSQPWPTVGFCS